MGDFHQHGIITSLHQLNQRPLEKIEEDLHAFRGHTPLGLILPSLYSELEGPALSNIVDELSKVSYLDQIVVGLDRANEEQFRHALKFFDRLPVTPDILWNDGPRLQEIDKILLDKGLAPLELGKGRNVWYMFGYILASQKAKAVAIHDCDITTYDRSMLANLIYPVAHPAFSYKFCKGYYARIANNTMNGRVCRLLVTPLLRALGKVCKPSEFLQYLDSFRYPLAGEFALTNDVIADIRIPSDWGLEMGVLSEMHRNYATNQICQVDIADIYDHKHQDLSTEDKTKGLSRMSSDIAKSLYRKMATQGEIFTPEKIRTIKAAYYRIALDLIDSYQNDALMNGLKYDVHKEGQAVDLFAENIIEAGNEFLDPEKSMDTPFMPSWKRVRSAVPDIMERLCEAVRKDREEFSDSVGFDTTEHPKVRILTQHLEGHVSNVYGKEKSADVVKQILKSAPLIESVMHNTPTDNKWTERDTVLITYADTIKSKAADESPLQSLHRFVLENLKGTITNIHLLPFCPYSSDDGFAVIDYTKVKEEHGTWSDIQAFGENFNIMADLVLNHCSVESPWFKNFLKGKGPGANYFTTGEGFSNLRQVVRPRPSPLLNTFKTADGEKEVWCTFSEDQADLNYANPDVLIEIIKIIKLYLEKGIKLFRFDAVAFLWKEDGTSCVHLNQTHEIIKLLRLIIETIEPRAIVITETNVPNKENLSYFGNNNEAHLIYNFSLPPLLLHTMLSGNCIHLKKWLMSMPGARRGKSYLNFIASHDGIGLRPAEGLLSEDELESMIQTIRSFGGEISQRALPDGALKPYEANISLYDAMSGKLGGVKDALQNKRFLCAHAILLALEGIPAIYIHSLLGTHNNVHGMAETGRLRTINRYQWDHDGLQDALLDKEKHHGEIFTQLKRLISIRQQQEAFHPNATQHSLHLGNEIFGFWRESIHRDQAIFALHNISDQPQKLAIVELSLATTETWYDLLSDASYDSESTTIELAPYQCVWLTNKKN